MRDGPQFHYGGMLRSLRRRRASDTPDGLNVESEKIVNPGFPRFSVVVRESIFGNIRTDHNGPEDRVERVAAPGLYGSLDPMKLDSRIAAAISQ